MCVVFCIFYQSPASTNARFSQFYLSGDGEEGWFDAIKEGGVGGGAEGGMAFVSSDFVGAEFEAQDCAKRAAAFLERVDGAVRMKDETLQFRPPPPASATPVVS